MRRLFLYLILGTLCAISAQGSKTAAQLITIPEMPKPTLDGKIVPAEWSGAAKLSGFYSIKDGNLIKGEEGFTWLGTDGKSLFIAVKTSNKGQEAGTGTIANVKDHDGPVWSDDAVEVYITSNNGDNLYQFVINSAGTVLDGEYAQGVMNKGWNGKIKTANLDQSGWWNIEIIIPLDQFKRQGDKLLVNVCRDWYSLGASTITGSKSYKDITGMLEINKQAGAPVVHEDRISGILTNHLNTSLQIHNPTQHALTLDWTVSDAADQPLPKNWIRNPYYDKCTVNLSNDSASGKNALHLASPGTSNGVGAYCEMPFALVPKQSFALSFMAKGEGLLYPQLYLYSAKGKNISVCWGKPVKLDEKWQTYKCELGIAEGKLGEDAPIAGKLSFHLKPGGNALLDKVNLSSSEKSYPVNGDYEECPARTDNNNKTYAIDSDRTIDFKYELKNKIDYKIKYQIKEKETIIYQRQMAFVTGVTKENLNPRPCSFVSELESSMLYGRLYPGFNRLAIDIDTVGWQKEKIEKIDLTLLSPSKKEIPGCAIFNQKNQLWQLVISELPRESGTWKMNVTYYGTSPNKVIYQKDNAGSFEIREFPWQNNQLGISDQVIPPFTPLKISDNSVACVLRNHTINNFGLWDQVKSLDSDILAGPITVEAVINGVKCSWQPTQLEFIKKLPNQVITKSIAETGNLKWQSLCTWDYDGFMLADVNLSATNEVKIERLTLTIPMKAEYCTLMHAVADTLRTNKAGIIPNGKGEVWNSSSVPKYRLNGKSIIDDSFVPYFWFGEERRGICWLADSGKGYSLDPKIPQIRILRTKENEVVAKIDLINQPVVIKQDRKFSFGLQATPVKPLPEKWRNWNLSCGQGGKIQDMLNITFCMHGIGLGKTSNCAAEPINDDYSFMVALGKALKSNKPDYATVKEFHNRIKAPYSEWMTKHEAEHHVGYLKYKVGNESYMEQKMRFLDTYLNQNMSFTADTDILVPYTDPRLQIIDSETAKYFISEWWGPQAISYPGLYRTYPTPSNIDYMLYVYKKHLDTGLGGIYIDDTYIMPNNDPLSDSSIIEDGKQKPVMGLLAMRELIKRTAVLQQQMGLNPRLLIVHCTNTFIIPCFTFADITYDWEMNYGAGDFQDRFALDLVRTESTGLQAGCVGSVLGGIVNSNNLSAKDWAVEKKRLTRTALAMTLLHEIQINATPHASDVQVILKTRSLLKEFGIQKDDCAFIPYWDKSSQISVSGQDFRCSYYKQPGKVLAIISNMGQEATAYLKLQPEKLGLKTKITLRDFESGKTLDNQSILVPKHDFRLVVIE